MMRQPQIQKEHQTIHTVENKILSYQCDVPKKSLSTRNPGT